MENARKGASVPRGTEIELSFGWKRALRLETMVLRLPEELLDLGRKRNLSNDERRLTSDNIFAIQQLKRSGHKLKEIHEVTGWSDSVISKYTKDVPQDSLPNPGPPQITFSTDSNAIDSSLLPGDPATPMLSSDVTETTNVFDGTLLVTQTRPAFICIIVPRNTLSPVIVSFTASGSPFVVQLLTHQQRIDFRQYSPKPQVSPRPFITVGHYYSREWESPQVSQITKQLKLIGYDDWYLAFQNDPQSNDGNGNSIKVKVNITTTRSG